MGCKGLIENMSFWHYLFEAVIILGATFAGVFFAFVADNWRERRANSESKKKLVIGLYLEIKELYCFFEHNPYLKPFTDYFIETRILEDTVGEQVKYINNRRLIYELSFLRQLVSQIQYKFKINSKAKLTTAEHVLSQRWMTILDEIKKDWETLQPLCIDRISIIMDLLKYESGLSVIEIPGDVYSDVDNTH